MALQGVDAGHHSIKRWFAAAGDAIAVVQLSRAVNRQADKELIRFEEFSPGIVNQDTVGLQIVFDPLAGLFILLLEFHYFVEKLQPHQGRFTALPGEDYLFAILSVDVLADKVFQRFIAHVAALLLLE